MANPIALVQRPVHFLAALVIVVASIVPVLLLLVGNAGAAPLDNRQIRLESSATGANGIKYRTEFKWGSTTMVKGIVIDICGGDSSPLIGLDCTTLTGDNFSWNSPVAADVTTFTINGSAQTVSDTPTAAQWGITTVESGRALSLTIVNGVTPTVGQTVVIEVDNVNNPDDVLPGGGNDIGTFFGRILTFPNNSGANSPATYVDTTTGSANVNDFGGIALSTTNAVTVTARVQEQIKFCIYMNTTSQNCTTNAGYAGVEIPNATDPLQNGALETSSSEGDKVWFGLESNALHGVDVRMYGGNGYQGVLASGTNTISAFAFDGTQADGDDAVCDTVDVAQEQFGLRVDPEAGSPLVAPSAPYNGAAGCYGWDGEPAGADSDAVGSEYGDIIATTAGPLNEEQTEMDFAAKALATTEAGIYTTSLNFIATGKY